MMKLQFLSEETLLDLRTNYGAYKEYYYTRDDEWFTRYFQEEGRLITSAIEVTLPVLNMDPDYVVSDRENVKIMYDALNMLTLSQATQERLWSGLAHTYFRDYMYYRISKELVNKNDTTINSKLFFKNGTKRSLFVHGLARLWWVGYATYDEENTENPYWLTDFFTEKDFSARATIFFSSNLTMNKDITRGILSALVQLQEEGVDIKRDHLVQAVKYFNVIGGAMILDMLTREEVKEMTLAHLLKLFEIERELIES